MNKPTSPANIDAKPPIVTPEAMQLHRQLVNALERGSITEAIRLVALLRPMLLAMHDGTTQVSSSDAH